MKRFHVHLAVADLPASIRFYSGLFGMEPTVTKHDYAKWMLDDPRVNFAISERGGQATGLDHLGLQTDSDDELAQVRERFEAADAASTVAEPGAHCCYAVSDKHWVADPQGIPWEAFHTLDSIPVWGAGKAAEASTGGSCCSGAPKAKPGPAVVADSGCCAGAATSPRSCC
ncbi:MAG: ArsI/CadI family heavy metal resistance metalloenzyme [Burkholderiales bacterium]